MAGVNGAGRLGWLVLALFLAAYGLDIAGDVSSRDCFSWMDPAQYFSFAGAVADGGRPEGGFEVASIFPWLVAPLLKIFGAQSVPAALSINLIAALVLAVAIVLIHRSLGFRSPPALSVVPVLSTILLIGLSRELYIEFTLTALVALQFALWFRTGRFTRSGYAAAFSLLFAAGVATKMTYGLFFAGPFVYEAVAAARKGDRRRIALLLAAVVLPAIVMIGGIRLAFPESFRYYASLGNTRIPIMRLIGPPDIFTVESLGYYISQLSRSILGYLSVFLLVPIALLDRVGGRRSGPGRERLHVLWLWLAAPLLILTFQAVKEPRHVAPVVVPAVLLVVAGLESIRGARLRGFLTAAFVALSLFQYLAVTRLDHDCPYRLRSGLGLREIETEMVRSDPDRDRHKNAAGQIDINRWRFTKSVAVSGFDPNEALAVAWHFAPAVVYDLDLPQWSEKKLRAYDRFEDLFYFSSLNSYNRRCNWREFYFSLDRGRVIGHADFILVRGRSEEECARLFPDHETHLEREGPDAVRLLRRREPATGSFRELYAREFLRRSAPADERELNTIYFSLFMVERLRGVIPDREKMLISFPEGFRPGLERRNIHWIAHDFPLTALTEKAYRDHIAGDL